MAVMHNRVSHRPMRAMIMPFAARSHTANKASGLYSRVGAARLSKHKHLEQRVRLSSVVVSNKSEAPVIRPMWLLPDHISLFLCPQTANRARLCHEMPSTLTHNKVILYCVPGAHDVIAQHAECSKGWDANGKWEITFICACFKCKCASERLNKRPRRDTARRFNGVLCLCTLCSLSLSAAQLIASRKSSPICISLKQSRLRGDAKYVTCWLEYQCEVNSTYRMAC
jgi:hypothetical protein